MLESTWDTAAHTAMPASPPISTGRMACQSLLLYSEFFLIGGNGSRTDTLNMEINLTALPQLPAGTYTGTLYLQAQML
jgi:hypothetical protein